MFTFSTALSALSAFSTGVDVVGNNLANLNTTGYKSSAVSFHDLVSQSLGTGLGETQVGFGTGRPITTRQFIQGAIQSSSGVLDAAIQGDGFFVVQDESGRQLFTRAGNFQVDASGNLLTGTREKVQGWTLTSGVVDPNSPIGDITIPVGTMREPSATSQFSLNLNLNAAAVVGQPDASFSTPIEVVDSLGASHVVTVDFTKTAANEWEYEITIPGAELAAGTPGTPTSLVTGTFTFDDSGRLLTPPPPPDPASAVQVAAAGLVTGAADLDIAWQLYTADGMARLTQFSQASAVSANEQDGLAPAQLVRVGLGDGGQVLAQYSNGQQRLVGLLAMASIRNPESLLAVGDNCLQASARTALPAIGLAETGGRGKILGGALEASTADIAREFTNLIVLQRGYQANARVITTVDEMSQETINLKR